MRILMVGPVLDVPGPIPRIVQLMRDGFVRAGCEVDMAHWGQHRPAESLLQKVFERSTDMLQLAFRLRKREHDVVFVHCGRDIKAMLREIPLSLAARHFGLPVFYMLHGTPDRWGSTWSERVWQALLGIVIRRASGVFVLSAVAKRAIEQRHSGVPVWLTRYPYCQALPSGPRRVFTKPEYTVVFVGRVIEDKGIHDLLTAWPRVVAATRARLLVCGDGVAMRNARRQASELRITDSVEFVGWQRADQIWQNLQRSDVFVLPTLREGFPSALLEAMAAGLPIVTTPVGGIPDWLQDGVNARFVVPRSPGDLAIALTNLLHDPSLRERMSEANIDLVKEFAPNRLVPRYLRLLGAKDRVPVTR